MEELRTLIKTIKTGTRLEVKAAQKQVERLFHRACRETELWPAFAVFAEEARGCDQIPDLAHKLAFL